MPDPRTYEKSEVYISFFFFCNASLVSAFVGYRNVVILCAWVCVCVCVFVV